MKKLVLFGLLAVQPITTTVWAQKKPLDHAVYDSWQSLGQKEISKNGQWIMYSVRPQEGDPTLFIEQTNRSKKFEINRAASGAFTNNDAFAVGLIKPFYKDQKLVQAKKLKKEKLAKDSLFIVNLNTSALEKIPNVTGYKLGKKDDFILAYTTEVQKDTTKKGAKPNDKLKDLVVKNLETNQETKVKNILEYAVSTKGNYVLYTLETNKKDSLAPKGVFVINTKDFSTKPLVDQKGTFKGFAFDENEQWVSFYGNQDDEKALIKYHQLYVADLNNNEVKVVIDEKTAGVPANWYVSGDKNLQFSKNGQSLFLGVAPIPVAKDTVTLSVDQAVVDVWGFRDDFIQPIQLKNLERELKRSYTTILDLNNVNQVVPVNTLEIADAQLLNEGDSRYLLLSSDYGKRIPSQWTASIPRTYYIYDRETKNKTEIITDLVGSVYASPKGNFIVYFDKDKGQWFSYNVANQTTTNLTKNLPVSFTIEDNDVPDTARQYGFAFFNEADNKAYIYDRYDIWAFDLNNNQKPQNVTNGYGRKNKVRFRIPKLHNEFKTLNEQDVVLLSSFNETDKQSGLYQLATLQNAQDPVLVIQEGVKGYPNIQKAENADFYFFTKENAIEPANLYVTQNLTNQAKLTQLNPQQANYNWHTVELVKWKTNKKNNSEGLLYKPENFDPNKKYPMIVYFYEKNNEELHRYEQPAPTPSRLNIPYFTSNGYVVFVPDIAYTDGKPGKSAEEYINSGVKYLIKKYKWINPDKIGIQGQSWGGYQVAHLITRTNMYAAGWAGAPVANMTSAYGGIRWGSGMTRQFQYEKTQSRIGKTLWEDLDLYIENSPLFHFDKVNTPVVIMHNDQDGAVPWYQGIEMYTALRRLDKPVWMLNYNGDDHNLIKRQNRKDIQIRQQQFFDYYLKDAKAPVWMTKGIPATSKGLDWGFELTDDKVE
ncbi:prolyl oligopeptidase family serine peptidase [Flavobacterium agricola]|uniref:Prolyl oligopeptidase family serine peptidase n=1 Tax=Flavobacterium agricola TaxID=2870839 RepID=A0ABY6M1H1_9FLAO|nr:prolyl oligopeptidase family serine peptidase [Flavobacterium agricola]UYW02281.1 prolyl oligopeptidase family serine peptidase [Flavobacterium agricola]